ncbi:hypothetical protein B7692_07390 [Streptococcus mitis]|uniref:Uncharacterized protein n=1 Tax=Streptococcus mitis TaxID=28037 RepID=A0A1X1L5G5_STRMT|nr:hypothetical protein B7692_07390 [Streptococcus mitis]
MVQFYFTKTIATMQKSNGKSVAFFGDKRLLSQTLLIYFTASFKAYTLSKRSHGRSISVRPMCP